MFSGWILALFAAVAIVSCACWAVERGNAMSARAHEAEAKKDRDNAFDRLARMSAELQVTTNERDLEARRVSRAVVALEAVDQHARLGLIQEPGHAPSLNIRDEIEDWREGEEKSDV